MRILVVRTSALGDTVLATPVFRALRARWPEAEIHFVTSGAFAPLFEGLPDLHRVWRWEPKERHAGLRGLSRFAAEVRAAGPFAFGIDLQNKARTSAFLSLVRPARRLAFVKRSGLVEVARSLAGDDPVLDRGPAAALYLEALAPLELPAVDLRPSIVVPPAAAAAADRLLAGADGAPIAALAPGARWALKRWAPERFAEVGDALAAKGARLVLAGGPGDLRELEGVRAALRTMPIGDTAGLDVAGLAAVLARSAVLVTGDSAPSHLAQAVGTPVVAVFGPTSARRWGPLAGAGTALSLPLACSPCSNHGKRGCPLGHHACLVDLPADPVAAVALAALRADREAGGDAAAAAARRELVPLAARAARGARELRP
ncbi:glycosyltransferase family 9 protein [Vulgatibacter sp.]|uniref:glycosyltransferase family 9 protein n=1 Tax=Vulgatibacter sp. TaxID=1971226 RepID=UPI0035627F6C